MAAEATELTRRFIDAFNARDKETLRGLLSDDAELVGPDGTKAGGFDGSEEVLRAAASANLRLARTGDEQVDEGEDVTRVLVPVRVTGGRDDDREAVGRFEINDERISAFSVEAAED